MKLNNINFLIFYSLISILVVSTISYSNFFIYRSLTSCFLYLTGISIFFIYSSLIHAGKKFTLTDFSRPIFIAGSLLTYVIAHEFIFNHTLSSYAYYFALNCGFFVALSTIIKIIRPNLQWVYRIIVVAALVESLICTLQYLKFSDSLNTYFPVTGTWENPNVTAMFIAICLPSVVALFNDQIKLFRKSIPFIILLLVGTLFMLKCRTAFIGSLFCLWIVLNHKFGLVRGARESKNLKITSLIIIVLLGITVPLINYAYQSKKASADGRTLIWKISSEMILAKPMLGYGYGSFEKNYNFFQMQYFESGKGSPDEMGNAGYVKMAYNELLQNAVEGGLTGCILFGGFLFSLLIVPINRSVKTNTKNTYNNHVEIAYSGVAVFAVMSLMNFTIQAIPVMCLFIIYAAILSIESPAISFKRRLAALAPTHIIPSANKFPFILRGICIALTGVISAYITLSLIQYNRENKIAALVAKNGDYYTALGILSTLSPQLDAYESFRVNYGNTFFNCKDYRNAIIQYTKATRMTSNPVVYSNLAKCYESIGDYKKAYFNLNLSASIEPSRIGPQLALMNLSMKLKDTTGALSKAQYIIAVTPKIPSQKTSEYKMMAALLIKRLGHVNNNGIDNKLHMGSSL